MGSAQSIVHVEVSTSQSSASRSNLPPMLSSRQRYSAGRYEALKASSEGLCANSDNADLMRGYPVACVHGTFALPSVTRNAYKNDRTIARAGSPGGRNPLPPGARTGE